MVAPLAETQCHDDHSTIMQSCKYKKLMSSMSTKQTNMVRLLLGKSKVDSLPVTAIALVCGTVPYIADTVEPHHVSSTALVPGYRPSGGHGHRREGLLIVDDVEVEMEGEEEEEEGGEEGGEENLNVLRMGGKRWREQENWRKERKGGLLCLWSERCVQKTAEEEV